MAIEITLTVTGVRQDVETLIKVWEILTELNGLQDDLEQYIPDISFIIECLVQQAPYVNDELLGYFADAQKGLAAVASGKWRPVDAQP